MDNILSKATLSARSRRANNDQLLAEIASFCQRIGMAESTFGRRVVNDGKLVSRLRFGGRVTTQTVDRINAFIVRTLAERGAEPSRAGVPASRLAALMAAPRSNGARLPAAAAEADAQTRFRFYDNRQKYLLFVSTCTEKWVVSQRIDAELDTLKPRPPALRVFDAGSGDGTVLTRLMRSMHDKFPHVPFYIVGKEISLEDVRLALEKMADRFHEHPSTVLVMTNLNYTEAPLLAPHSLTAATSMVWHEVPLAGTTAAEFDAQIT